MGLRSATAAARFFYRTTRRGGADKANAGSTGLAELEFASLPVLCFFLYFDGIEVVIGVTEVTQMWDW